jgi:hypothetical protein
MPRNAQFTPGHEPLRDRPDLHLQHRYTTGTFSYLNPTRAVFNHNEAASAKPVPSAASVTSDEERANATQDGLPSKDEQAAQDIKFTWRSRDNRKGRHLLQVKREASSKPPLYTTPKKTSTWRATGKGVVRMFTQFPYWDVSYLVATIFTLGSVVWVINAFFAWLPLVAPSTEFHNEGYVGGGVTAFIGATIFEIGSVLLMFEAVNENNAGCFGWALEKVFSDQHGNDIVRVKPSKKFCSHHHANKKNVVGKATDTEKSSNHDGKTWQWFPSRNALTTHYFRELGFLASLAQFCGATVFWISGFTALPGIINHFSQGLLDGVYWTPQMVGGTGFVISGCVFRS